MANSKTNSPINSIKFHPFQTNISTKHNHHPPSFLPSLLQKIMLTKTSLQLINLLFKQATFLKTIPFEWNSKEFQLKTISNSKRSILKYIPTIILCFQTIFLLIQFLINKAELIKNQMHYILHVNFFLICLILTIFGWNTLTHEIQLVEFINKYFGVIKLLNEGAEEWEEQELKMDEGKKMEDCALCACACVIYKRL